MSAFLCSAGHVGALAHYYAEEVRRHRGEDPSKVAVLLGQANLDSLAARYPDTKGAADWTNTAVDDTDYLVCCSAEARRSLRVRRPRFHFEGIKGHARIFRMARCFEYQACETGDEWRASEAREVILAIICHAGDVLSERELGDEFVWSYDEPATAQAVAS